MALKLRVVTITRMIDHGNCVCKMLPSREQGLGHGHQLHSSCTSTPSERPYEKKNENEDKVRLLQQRGSFFS